VKKEEDNKKLKSLCYRPSPGQRKKIKDYMNCRASTHMED
jgi:hypothetical protein